MAGVAIRDIHFRFAWQAWHLGHWAGSGGALGLDWSPVTPRHFAWQAWRLATSAYLLLTVFHTQLCHTPSFATPCFTHRFVTHTIFHTHNFVTRSLSQTQTHTQSFTHTTLSHTIFHSQLCHTHKHTHTVFLCHTLSFTYHFVTHNSSHTLFYFSIIHHILCLSFLPRPPYNVCRSVLEEVDLWGYPVL